MLTVDDVKKEVIDGCKIFHFGSVSMTNELSKSATQYAVEYAKKQGSIISFDPNYRPLLWKNTDTAKQTILDALPLVNILKVSEEEMLLLTGESDLQRGSALLARHCRDITLMLISLGPRGAFYRFGTVTGWLKTFDTNTIDTTGAGDAFLGSIHHRLRGLNLDEICKLSSKQIEDIIIFANAAGALTTNKYGAIPAMPSRNEINLCIEKIPLLS